MAPRWDREVFNTLRHDRTGVIRRSIAEMPGVHGSAADFGCGTGVYLPLLSRAFAEVHGFDWAHRCVESARKRSREFDNITVHLGDSVPSRFRCAFDLVICVNVAIDPSAVIRRRVLRNAYALARRGGRLIIVVPAAESAVRIAQMGEGSRLRSNGIVDVEGVLTKHYSKNELTAEVASLGLRSVRVQRVNYSWRSHGVTSMDPTRRGGPWDWLVLGRKTDGAVRHRRAVTSR
jgi:SAM-dependent methyltransferase